MRERLTTIWQIWQNIAERLRQRGALLSLAVLLSIGLIEPLACIAHCTMLDVLYAGQTSGHQHHNHAVASGAPVDVALATSDDVPATVCLEQHLFSTSAAANCDAPTPQPFHEMTLLTVVVLVPLALVAQHARQATGPPAEFFSPPLLRPPLLCA